MSAPKGNQYAAKPGAECAESFLHIRCTRRDKSGWVRAANKQRIGLSEWVITALKRAAESK